MTLDYPGALYTTANGINNSGAIVGFYQSPETGYNGFIFTSNNFTLQNVPTAKATYLYGINKNGTIVGSYADGADFTHGFLKNGSSFTTVNGASHARSINDAGQIVGDSPGESFLLSEGVYQSFTLQGASRTDATGINNTGTIVGSYQTQGSSTFHGFQYSSGSVVQLDDPLALRSVGAQGTRALAINNIGQIVGTYFSDTRGTAHGFIYSGGLYTTLDYPGASTTSLIGINDLGQIVGGYQDSFGNVHGFLATPVSTTSVPVVDSVTPSAGSAGSNQAFTFTYSDIDGYQDISGSQVIINSTPTGIGSCYVLFGRGSNAISLVDDAGVAGPLTTLGAPTVLQNSQCSVLASISSQSVSSSSVMMTIYVVFKPGFTGSKNVYSAVSNNAGVSSGLQLVQRFIK